MMATISAAPESQRNILVGLRKTIKSMVDLVSTDKTDKPLQINIRQCQLLANKASETMLKIEEFETFLQHQELNDSKDGQKIPDWTPAAMELHRVLKEAESLFQDSCCGDQWQKVAICQGNLKETFAKILQEIDWHISVVCSVFVTDWDVFETMLNCDGQVRFTDYFSLQAAAKHDLQSLRDLLKVSHNCDGLEVCKADCLAIKLLEKLNAEEKELVDRKNPLAESNTPLFLWVDPEDLRQGEALGRGSFAEVRKTNWLGQTFAWKIFQSGTDYATFKRELAVMAGLDHPHVVRVICVSEDPHHVDLGIVMELMYTSLFDFLKEAQKDFRRGRRARGTATPFSISQSVDLMLQIAEGMRYIHSKGLAHRDLKSQNILLQRASPPTGMGGSIWGNTPAFLAKIADFGLTKIKNDSTAYGNQTLNTGTRKWMAPEVWSKINGMIEPAPSDRFQPKKMDVYSFGITCYEILSGEEPYPGPQQLARDLYSDVKLGKRPTLPSGTPRRLAALIQRCWDGKARQRPDFSAICSELRFIKGLLLRGDDLALKQTKTDIGPGFSAETGVKVQGPWGVSIWGTPFSNGVHTSIQQIKLRYDTVGMLIRSIEIEYDLNGTSFISGHGLGYGDGNPKLGTMKEIKIDDPNEYVTKIEGAFGSTAVLTGGGNRISCVTSLTIHTNQTVHGPFGGFPEGATKFESEPGRIVGFYGRCGMVIDSIGCYTVPVDA